MKRRPQDESARSAALAMWEVFCRQILPGTLRRIMVWKSVPRARLPELLAEVQQELAVDTLEHAELIATLPLRSRHLRWMRLASRWLYRHWQVRRQEPALAEEPATSNPPTELVPTDLPPVPSVVLLQNGRTNLAASAAVSGRGRREVGRELRRWAEAVGRDGAYHGFWRRRTAEALTGLAADLLRDHGRVLLAPRPRAAPDPDHRLRRLRRLASRFVVQPGTRDERSTLRRWTKAPRLGPDAPRQLLEDAVALAPHDTAAWLWLFEACLGDGDLRAAARALRQARLLGEPERMALLLARARLLEARGRWPAACALLQRARQRWPHDQVLARWCARLIAPG
ncbi:MAG: hypothetical protein MUC36_08780 [Planctomycetes bacterium]|jgi:tetratricopeptide (TPR) repeat protein|nr:hypothetical protein [Planctomycetota bacterium]